MKLANLSGIIPIRYKVTFRQIEGDEFAQVELHTALPGQDFEFKDLVTEISDRTYQENLRVALIKAEQRWGIKLLEIDIETLTTL